VSIVEAGPLEAMVGDPDDHRPASRWGLKVDPGDDQGRVETLAIITEEIAPGDRIPLHTHDVDEAITILDGTAQTRLGKVTRRVGPETVIFVPAGVPHGIANAAAGPLQIHAALPATTIEIAMLERNPAPGTEADPPRRSRYDLRTGEFVHLDRA
jgi:quercetin dioxygenase-like cupin family protein